MSSIIASNIKESFQVIINKYKISPPFGSSMLGKSSIRNESYQEAQYSETLAKVKELLSILYKFQSKLKTNILNLVAKNLYLFSTSLLAYAIEISYFITALKEQQKLTSKKLLVEICQKHHTSQSILLALYLTLVENYKVKIITDKSCKKQWESFLIGSDQPDPSGKLQTYIETQGIKVVPFQIIQQRQSEDSDFLTIIDIFDVSPTVYRPFLLKHLPQIIKNNAILYYSNSQVIEVSRLIEQELKIMNFEQNRVQKIQVNPSHPSDYLQNPSPQQILVKFLQQERKHPKRQDIIIFFPSAQRQSIQNYLVKLQDNVLRNLKGSADFVNVISKPNMTVSEGKNNIFVAEDSQQLKRWNYFYGNVFYVIDYGYQIRFFLDYRSMTYVQTIKPSSTKEMTKRQNFSSAYKIGRYIQSVGKQDKEYVDELQFDYVYQQYGDQTDISNYILSMVANGLGQFLELDNKTIKQCVNSLIETKIICKNEGTLEIINHECLKYKTNPLFTKLILKSKGDEKLVNLIIMAVSILITRGTLRKKPKIAASKASNKPIGIWRQSGYLHSALDIITKTQLIENQAQVPKNSQKSSKRSQIKKNASLANEQQFGVYGNLFQIVQPKKLSFEEMQFTDFVRQNLINQEILHKIKDHIDHFREMFNIEQKNIYLKQSDISQVIKEICNGLGQGKNIGVYSGSRRVGYLVNNENKGVFPYRSSLMALLNENPQYLFVLRLIENKGSREILVSNSVTPDNYMNCISQLPCTQRKSYGECQVEFHGVSSATIEQLHSHFGKQIQKFEQQCQCMVEPNEEMAIIIIYCPKNKQKIVKQKFEAILTKIKQKLVNRTKIMNYLGNTNIALGNGGVLKEIIKDSYITKCRLGNLHYNCSKQDLEELFQEFFRLKDITMQGESKNKYKASAIIEFHSQRDYYRFSAYFNECLFMGKYMQVQPIQDTEKKTNLQKEMYIKVYWSNWKSHSKAIVEYEEEDSAKKALEDLSKESTTIDGKRIFVENKNKQLILSDLKPITDEIFLDQVFKVYGAIKDVQILKTPAKQSGRDNEVLDFHLRSCLQKENNVKFDIGPIQKGKNGIRSVKILFYDQKHMKKVCTKFHKQTEIIGTGRVYMSERYTFPVLLPSRNLMNLYQALLDEVIKGLPPQNELTKITTTVFEDYKNSKLYIIVKSRSPEMINTLSEKFVMELQGVPAQLSQFQKNVLLNEIGFANVIDLQEKYPCRLIPNYLKKTLNILTPIKYLKKIKEEIKFKINESFFYRIPLNSRGLKYLKQNPDKYQSMEKTYHLSILQLQEVSKCLVLQGSAEHVQNALTYLMHLLQSIAIPQQQMINTDACGICCQEPSRPYRLQKCGHRFCLNCIVQSLTMALGDMSMFPLKCPHCLTQLVINDLDSLLEEAAWQKLLNMSVNQYIGKNPQNYTFCFTAGCKQIGAIISDHFKCDTCLNVYCLQCKLNYHPGMTCEQAKNGGDLLFKKFMEENNIRKCPNDKCGMPIERIDGCYRVTCNRCGKSMCFKCQADKMIAYDNYNDCYKHLTDAHGGYW